MQYSINIAVSALVTPGQLMTFFPCQTLMAPRHSSRNCVWCFQFVYNVKILPAVNMVKEFLLAMQVGGHRCKLREETKEFGVIFSACFPPKSRLFNAV